MGTCSLQEVEGPAAAPPPATTHLAAASRRSVIRLRASLHFACQFAMSRKAKAGGGGVPAAATAAALSLFRAHKNGVLIGVRLTPNSSQNAVTGNSVDDDGRPIITVRSASRRARTCG